MSSLFDKDKGKTSQCAIKFDIDRFWSKYVIFRFNVRLNECREKYPTRKAWFRVIAQSY